MEEKFEDLGGGWKLQETPSGYYLWFPSGEYLSAADGQPYLFPTRAVALAAYERAVGE